MAPDSEDVYTEVTEHSCLGNIARSCLGTIIGLLLFIAAFPTLWWNEGRSLHRVKALAYGEKVVVSAKADRVDPSNDGKLVYLTGKAQTGETLRDTTFQLAIKALKLRRTVEMYQWRQETDSREEKKLGGGSRTVTTYSYTKIWSEEAIDSSGFKLADAHKNPAGMPWKSSNLVAKHITLGVFHLSPGLINHIDAYESLPVDEKSIKMLPAKLRAKTTVSDGMYYVGKAPAAPKIGDVRIAFTVIKPIPVSLVACQVSDTFEPYPVDNGETIELLKPGTMSAGELFRRARIENSVLTWVFRGVGILMLVVGIALCFGPFVAVANIIPFFGDVVEAGVGLAALCTGLVLGCGTIAIAWIWYRPLVGIPLLAGALLLLMLGASAGRRKRRRRG